MFDEFDFHMSGQQYRLLIIHMAVSVFIVALSLWLTENGVSYDNAYAIGKSLLLFSLMFTSGIVYLSGDNSDESDSKKSNT